MLPFFVLIVFALFGVAAAVIDTGLVVLTRVQMQNAADAAAVEGVRLRNLEDPEFSALFEADCWRRFSASRVVSWTFDSLVAGPEDGLEDCPESALKAADPMEHPTRGAPGDLVQLGAGPDLALPGGVGDWNAMELIGLNDPRVYKPTLQLNQTGNLPEGDLVSGRVPDLALGDPFPFDPFDPTPPEGPSPQHPDFAEYERADFVPLSAVDPTATGPLTDPLFLVRLRRTNDVLGLDNVAEVSSAGAALPLLFGRGTTIGKDPDADYSPRRDGITVRATAIARERPAMRVGTCDPPCLGALPFVIDRAFWEEPSCWDSTFTTEVQIAGGGELTAPEAPSPCHHVGAFVKEDATDPETAVTLSCYGTQVVTSLPYGLPRRSLPTVGQLVALVEPDGLATQLGYAPLVEPLDRLDPLDPESPQLCRVVGFGLVRLLVGGVLTLTKFPNRIAPANATAHLVGGLPGELVFAGTEAIEAVLNANQSLADPDIDPQDRALFVPVLWR
jgi:hypothetical protein